MKVGTARPELRSDWMEKNLIWRTLARFDYCAAWFFYLFNTVALVRFAIEFLAAAILTVTAFGVLGEILEREKDRAVRVATLFVQIAQTRALPKGKGLKAVLASVEALAHEGVSMQGFDLSNTDLGYASLSNVNFVVANFENAFLSYTNLEDALLIGANFSGADLVGANLRTAVLSGADLTKANLAGADLTKANLSGLSYRGESPDPRDSDTRNPKVIDVRLLSIIGANLAGANLSDTDLSGANLSSTKGLTHDQLDKACADPNNPPKLPTTFIWLGPPCD